MGFLTDIADEKSEVEPFDFGVAKDMAETLHAHYPNHLWAVTCDSSNGIATIRNLSISGEYGYVLKLNLFSTASEWKKTVISAGGEILERFRQVRGAVDFSSMSSLGEDFSGRTIGDYSK